MTPSATLRDAIEQALERYTWHADITNIVMAVLAEHDIPRGPQELSLDDLRILHTEMRWMATQGDDFYMADEIAASPTLKAWIDTECHSWESGDPS